MIELYRYQYGGSPGAAVLERLLYRERLRACQRRVFSISCVKGGTFRLICVKK